MSKHVEYKRMVDGARVAVLLVHGILSTPNHFRELIPLIPDNYSVWAMVTDGHCRKVRDFSRSSMKGWERSVENAVEELLQAHDEVYMVGHSMGTLMSIRQAIKNPKVTRLFCIAVPIKVRVRVRMIGMALKVYFDKIDNDDLKLVGLKESYGIDESDKVFRYLGWIPRFLDLFKMIAETRKSLGELKTPCTAYQSALDELVSPKSVKILRNESQMHVVELKNSTHFYYEPLEMDILKQEFIIFLS